MVNNYNANHSYWEIREFFREWDMLVIGSGIVGLSTAISYKEKNPGHSVLVIERGMLPSGASTKNAGFACFGSPGELLSDLSRMPESVVWDTVQMRWKGLQMLRKRLGARKMGFEKLGGYELFFDQQPFDQVRSRLTELNKSMRAATGITNCYSESKTAGKYFEGLRGAFLNREEGQIDTGMMMKNLTELARYRGVVLLNGAQVKGISEQSGKAEIHTLNGTFRAKAVVVATNGFARELLKLDDIKPARAQVLVTSPISGLKIKGTYHFDEGYYYFRNIDGRILFGGGRHLDLETEYTDNQGLNPHIQSELDRLLRQRLLKGLTYSVEHRWSGIMGVGTEKQPIIRHVAPRVIAAVRMGGMGIAIGSWVGEKASELAEKL
jgi:gamma-glutamylputrescine oxidase